MNRYRLLIVAICAVFLLLSGCHKGDTPTTVPTGTEASEPSGPSGTAGSGQQDPDPSTGSGDSEGDGVEEDSNDITQSPSTGDGDESADITINIRDFLKNG